MNARWEPFAGRRVAHVLVVDRVGGRIAYGPSAPNAESESLCGRIAEPSGLSPQGFTRCERCLLKLDALRNAAKEAA